jgi:hypothetical protein
MGKFEIEEIDYCQIFAAVFVFWKKCPEHESRAEISDFRGVNRDGRNFSDFWELLKYIAKKLPTFANTIFSASS